MPADDEPREGRTHDQAIAVGVPAQASAPGGLLLVEQPQVRRAGRRDVGPPHLAPRAERRDVDDHRRIRRSR